VVGLDRSFQCFFFFCFLAFRAVDKLEGPSSKDLARVLLDVFLQVVESCVKLLTAWNLAGEAFLCCYWSMGLDVAGQISSKIEGT